jgi:arylsulfatase
MKALLEAIPNLLLITTDQQRADTIQAAGARHVWTPRLDWLCDSGLRFPNAFSAIGPCRPASRATGKCRPGLPP